MDQSPDRFVFGSEIAALAVVPGMSRKIRPQAVDDFFAYGYVPEPGTIFEGIHKLPAGCTLTLDRSGRPPRISRYWAPPETAQPRAEDEAKNILSQKITEAVA
jgi:asparagine synthase (glutamine-hydrolysing)